MTKYRDPRHHAPTVQPIVSITVTSGDSGMITVPADGPLTDDAVVLMIATASRRRPIAEAPKTGAEIRLFRPDIPTGIRGVWRITRRFAGRRWVLNAFWASPVNHKPLGGAWTEWEPLQ